MRYLLAALLIMPAIAYGQTPTGPLQRAQNGADVPNAATFRTNLGIPTIMMGVRPGGATVSSSGTGAATSLGYSLTLQGGTASAIAKVTVVTIRAVSGTVAVAGSGGVDGTCIVTGTTGAFIISRAKFNVTISGGAMTAVNSVSDGGEYTSSPTISASEPVTGCSLTGAQVNMEMGVKSVAPQTIGEYSVVPSNPVSTTGLFVSGVTLNIAWAPLSSEIAGHIISYGAGSPGVTNCGTTAGFSGGNNDIVGKLDVTGTALTACTVVFKSPYGTPPLCVANLYSASTPMPITMSASTLQSVTFVMGALSSGTLTYMCMQPN